MPTPPQSPDRRSIELIFLDMRARAACRDRDFATLSPPEQIRASRFRLERDRARFIACRATLRGLLAARTGERADAIVFEFGPFGKPAIAAPGIDFNISHAGDWFACAISRCGPVGIDIEHIHALDDMLAVAQHFFASAEVEHLLALPEEQRTRGFFECWTRKEAVIKATGEGVSRPLDSFEVAFGPGRTPALLRLDHWQNPGWELRSFEPAPGYLAALAHPGLEEPAQCDPATLRS